MNEPACDGLCITAADVGVPVDGIAYAHPGCPLHDPEGQCECGMPDACLSPTHDPHYEPGMPWVINQRRGE